VCLPVPEVTLLTRSFNFQCLTSSIAHACAIATLSHRLISPTSQHVSGTAFAFAITTTTATPTATEHPLPNMPL
jgi:hypothetical protein